MRNETQKKAKTYFHRRIERILPSFTRNMNEMEVITRETCFLLKEMRQINDDYAKAYPSKLPLLGGEMEMMEFWMSGICGFFDAIRENANKQGGAK